MFHDVNRAVWWVIAYERPRWVGDYVGMLALVGLAVFGAMALAWPWLSTEAPRMIAAGWAVVQATVAAWLAWLWSALPKPTF